VSSAAPFQFTAAILQDGPWWIGWIEEIPGVNAQEATRDDMIASLRVALGEALAMNRADAAAAAPPGTVKIHITP
jgi:predicted RNase H-like HicB family nuclease